MAVKLQFIVNCHRETREGRSLLTVETEANGDFWSTNGGGPSLVHLLGSSCLHKRFFILPWLLWSAQYNIIIFLTVHYFNFCDPVSQQPRQAVVQGRLSLKCVSPVLLIICNCGPHRRPYIVYFSQCKHLFCASKSIVVHDSKGSSRLGNKLRFT